MYPVLSKKLGFLLKTVNLGFSCPTTSLSLQGQFNLPSKEEFVVLITVPLISNLRAIPRNTFLLSVILK